MSWTCQPRVSWSFSSSASSPAGWPARSCAAPGSAYLGDLVVGIVGAFIATLLFPRLGIHLGSGILSEILYSALGAIILLLIVRLIRGRRV